MPHPGTWIDGRYLVRETLAVGGMSCVVEATHQLMGRPVAIKLARADRPGTARQLVHEARILQRLTTKHAVRIYDLGLHREAPYMVMELLDGQDLGAALEHEGPLPVERAVDCVLEAAVALNEAHALGVVHQDVKPTNLFVARTPHGEQVKVIDFGIARKGARSVGAKAPSSKSGVRARLEDHRGTRIMGTPAFMSPEQIRCPSSVDERSDVWSLAVTLYQLVTGEPPFTGAGRVEMTHAILAEEPRRIGRHIGAPWLDDVLERALAKHRDERTASMVALAADLHHHATDRGRRARDRLLRTSDAKAPRATRTAMRSAMPSLPTTVDRAPSSGLVG